MLEDFVQWTKKKVRLHVQERDIRFRDREIWWCSLGKNIGYEQNGKHATFERPVLVLKKFNTHVLWIIPLTRSGKENGYYHRLKDDSKNSFLVLSQIRLVSSKRLLRRMRRINEDEFMEICKKVKSFI